MGDPKDVVDRFLDALESTDPGDSAFNPWRDRCELRDPVDEPGRGLHRVASKQSVISSERRRLSTRGTSLVVLTCSRPYAWHSGERYCAHECVAL